MTTWPEVPPGDRKNTVSHLASTALTAIGHVSRHIAAAQDADTDESTAFNLEHAAKHIGEAREHTAHLIWVLGRYYPGVGAETDALAQLADPQRSAAYWQGFEESRELQHSDLLYPD